MLVVLFSGCDLFSGKPGTVEIAVKLADGTPVKNIELSLREKDKIIDEGGTNEKGLLKLSAKAGKYQLIGSIVTETHEILINEEVVIEKNKTVNKLVTVQNLGKLSINVKDKLNGPLSGAEVTIKDSNKAAVTKVTATTDQVEALLKPGTYYIDVKKDDVTLEDHEVTLTSALVTVNITLDIYPTYNLALNKDYRMLKPAEGGYPDTEKELTNGVVGAASFGNAEWVGTLGGEERLQVIVVDLDKEYLVTKATVVGLKDGTAGIDLPLGITVAISSDGVNWTPLEKQTYELPPEEPKQVVRTHEQKVGDNARFVAYKFDQSTNWLFLGEIEVYGTQHTATDVPGDLATIDLAEIF